MWQPSVAPDLGNRGARPHLVRFGSSADARARIGNYHQSPEQKFFALKILPALMDAYGTVSGEVAIAMAEGALQGRAGFGREPFPGSFVVKPVKAPKASASYGMFLEMTNSHAKSPQKLHTSVRLSEPAERFRRLCSQACPVIRVGRRK